MVLIVLLSLEIPFLPYLFHFLPDSLAEKLQ